MKVLFMGTPEFAIPSLKAILSSNHELVGVVTQPDRLGARGKKIIYSPVKKFALENNIKLFQFEKINAEVDVISELNADIGVTAAYGQILSTALIDSFENGIINVHASILPKYRGSSPVQCALLNGEKELGVSIMQTVKEVDAGDVWAISKYNPDPLANASECLDELALLGGELLVKVLNEIESGNKRPVKQDATKATFCKKIEKEDGFINFNEKAQNIVNKIRAYTPWPSVYFNSRYGRIKLLKAKIADVEGVGPSPGQVLEATKKGLIVACLNGAIEVLFMQGENARPMKATDFLLGKPFEKGEIINN